MHTNDKKLWSIRKMGNNTKKLAIKMRLFNKAKKYAAILSELRRNLCLTKNPFETNGNLTVTIVTC